MTNPLKILTVVGARPQFIKAAPVSKALRESCCCEFLVHTGQHYDEQMSEVFFSDFGLPKPDCNLGIGSGSHGRQTGEMLISLEEVMQVQKPDWVLVYGDTNSTLAGALAACKLRIPTAHVEAGLRSFNREMPEEHNRVLTDHCSDLLFCPTKTAVENLRREGITQGVHLVGDTMYDAVRYYAEVAPQRSTILNDLDLKARKYLLATVHRPHNTDVSENLRNILLSFKEIDELIIFPVHPRTRRKIAELNGMFGTENSVGNLRMIEPVGYLDMLVLEQNARVVLTDSGGVQKEAYFLGVPCVTLRSETEWVETVEAGWNVIVGSDRSRIIEAVLNSRAGRARGNEFGDGCASQRIAEILQKQQLR